MIVRQTLGQIYKDRQRHRQRRRKSEIAREMCGSRPLGGRVREKLVQLFAVIVHFYHVT